ncbi:MAG: MG2 domain-containing protein [bacterium]
MRRFSLLSVSILWIGVLFALFLKMDTPLGSVEGFVIAGENGKPIPEARVSFYGPFAEAVKPYTTETDENGHFLLRGLPAGTYTLSCESSAHYLPYEYERTIHIREGKTSRLFLTLSRSVTNISVWTDEPMFSPNEKIRIWAQGYAPSEKLRLSLYRLQLEQIPPSRLFELSKYAYPLRQPGIPPSIEVPKKLILQWEEKIERDAEDTFYYGKKLPPLESGIYKLEVASAGIKAYAFFGVTSLALLLKQDGEKAVVWATDWRSGKPLPNVSLLIKNQGKIISGSTNEKGLWVGNIFGPCKIVGWMDSSYAFLSVEPYEAPSPEKASYKIYTYTERPIYRPGQTVFFKCIVRRYEKEEYKVPPSLKIAVDVKDEEDNILYSTNLRTNSFGSCSGSFKIPSSARPGIYNIFVSAPEVKAYDVRSFNVSIYRKPEFEVEVKTGKARYRFGERARVEVRAKYLFGVPVPFATVEFEVYRSPYYSGWEYGWEEMDSSGELVTSGTTQTDSQGKAVILIPLKKEKGLIREFRYSVDVRVTDASERTVSASTEFSVARSKFSLYISAPKRILKVGEPINITLSASAIGKGKRNIDVFLYKLIWRGKKQIKDKISQWTIPMKNKEKKNLPLSLSEEGEYELVAEIKGEILDALPLTALPSLEEGVYHLPYPLKYPRLYSDKSIYNKGEDAFVILDIPYKATALLTYEGKRLWKYEVRELKRGRHLIKIANLGNMGYNFSFRVSIVKNKRLVEESLNISVERPILKLKMALKTDRNIYQPREGVFCKLKLEDSRGRPLKGELSIAVVDEGIFKILDEDADADIRSAFTPFEAQEVVTRWSAWTLFLGPVSKAFTSKEVRRLFLDTAFWLPSLVTDDKGCASFHFKLPDNITSWRITAVGNTLNSIFGAGKINIITRKPLFVRLGMPSFLRQGDVTTIAGILQNQTEKTQDVGMELKAKGLQIISPKEKRLTVGGKKEGKEEWQIKVGEETSATLTLYALAKSGLKDAMQLDLPILPFGLPTQYTKTSWLDSDAYEIVNIEKEAIPSTVQLKIHLAPSILSSLYTSLEYLAQYPYGCTEQTVSAFLPDIALYRLLKETGIRNEELERKLPDMIMKGIFRLYYLRNDDGAWGWMPNSESLPWTTAYALWGLWEAEREGYPVNKNVIETGRDRLIQLINQNLNEKTLPELGKGEKEELLFSLYILTNLGVKASTQLDYFLPILHKLSPKSLALLTLSYLNLGDKGKAQTVFKTLWNKREESGDICYWNDGLWTIESTGYALRALLKLQPDNPTALKVVNYLLKKRKEGEWLSTRDTAQIILSLLEFVKVWENVHPNFSLLLKINGKQVKEIHFTSKDVFSPPKEIILQIKDLKFGRNEITLLKRGKGRLFYSLKLSQVLKREKIRPIKGLAGIKIKRVYLPLSVSTKQGLEWKAGSARELFNKGKLLEVRVLIDVPRRDLPSQYFILEEPLPAGCELIEVDEESLGGCEYEELEDRLAFYIPYLQAGKNELRYRLRANIVGDYRVMPTLLYNMYFPQYRSIGNSNVIRIK